MDRELARRGGVGDQAGRTATPAIYEFLSLLRDRQTLFTQDEYADYCHSQWPDWWNKLSKQKQDGVNAKLFNNFYVSMIDSLHAWSLLCEAQWFDTCTMDTYSDVIGKTDLTLITEERQVRVALVGPFARARQDLAYKRVHRNQPGDAQDIIVVQLDGNRPKRPGNKRWYCLDDFAALRPIAPVRDMMQLGLSL